jgi:hypothetical protein
MIKPIVQIGNHRHMVPDGITYDSGYDSAQGPVIFVRRKSVYVTRFSYTTGLSTGESKNQENGFQNHKNFERNNQFSGQLK